MRCALDTFPIADVCVERSARVRRSHTAAPSLRAQAWDTPAGPGRRLPTHGELRMALSAVAPAAGGELTSEVLPEFASPGELDVLLRHRQRWVRSRHPRHGSRAAKRSAASPIPSTEPPRPSCQVASAPTSANAQTTASLACTPPAPFAATSGSQARCRRHPSYRVVPGHTSRLGALGSSRHGPSRSGSHRSRPGHRRFGLAGPGDHRRHQHRIQAASRSRCRPHHPRIHRS